MPSTLRMIRTLVAATAILVAGAAHADLVTNGGFETGNFSGWTQFGNTGFTGVGGGVEHAGSFGAFFGPTSADAKYDVIFYIEQTGAASNTFAFNWDGSAAEWTYLDINPGFTTLHFTLTASTNATDLRFTFSNPPSFWYFDDVSVLAVPEPGSPALLGLGLGIVGLAVATRRRR